MTTYDRPRFLVAITALVYLFLFAPIAVVVLVFLPAVGDFISAQLLGGPDTYMVGNLIQQQFSGAENWPFGAALTVVLMAFLMIFMFFYLRGSEERREALT